ncbi:MAG: FHA domain-containing protein [Lachnospiraceae bacterium]|nr:FHA domain-containing protein [Lachnospiraceae bacterium]
METEYRQDLCKRTMTVKRSCGEKGGFREKMVIKNNIRGLARMNIRHLNGESRYCFDMGSCQTLKNAFEGNPMSIKDIKALFSGILNISEELGKYLLDLKDIMMEPEHIFWDLEKNEPYFCYYPDYPESEEGFFALGRFLMDVSDKSSEKAAGAAYGYFDRISEGILLPADLYRGSVEYRPTEIKEDKPPSDTDISEILPVSELWKDDEEENFYFGEPGNEKTGDKKPGRLFVFLSFLPAVFAAGIYAYIFMNPSVMILLGLSDRDYIRGGIAVIVISGLFISLGVYIWNKRKKEEEIREKDMDSLNSDITGEAYCFDPLEEKAMESAERNRDTDNDATVILSGFSGGSRQRCPSLSGRIAGEEKVLKIERTPYMIGKLRNKADGLIPDPKVSRIHACIREEGGRYYLSDLNSTNGTSVNEKRLGSNETAEPFDGDTVCFADTVFTFRLA